MVWISRLIGHVVQIVNRTIGLVENTVLEPDIKDVIGLVGNSTSLTMYQANSANTPSTQELFLLKTALDEATIWLSLDSQGLIKNASKKFCEICQLSAEELLGKDFKNYVVHPEGTKANHSISFPPFDTKTWEGELQLFTQNNNSTWVEAKILPVFDRENQISAFIAIAFDITERKKQEQLLQQRDEQLELALQAARLGIWDWDIISDRVTWQHSTDRLFGLPLDTFQGTYEDFLGEIYPSDREATLQTTKQAIEELKSCEQEFRLIEKKNGRLHWIALKSQVCADETGRAVRTIGITEDITQHKIAEVALQNQNERERLFSLITQRLRTGLERQVKERTAQLQQALDFEAMLKRITDKVRDSLDESQILQTAVKELGLGLGVRCCNASLYNLDAGTSTICYEYTTSMFSDRGRESVMANYPEIYQQLLAGQYLQLCNIQPNPVRGRVTMLACPIFDNQGVLGDLWLINDKDYGFRDLELRMVQQVATQCAIAIRQARLYEASQLQIKALEKLNWLKDDFLSTVSHELRAPVANMRMAIRMLKIRIEADQKVSGPNEKINQYLQILHRECEREISLIDDLLDLQRLEAGRQSMVLETVQLKTWLPDLVEGFKERASARQQQLIVDFPAMEIPPFVSDISSLGRIIGELVHNACKYTPSGEKILIRTRYKPGKVQFQISNFGVEIPEPELPLIFDKFYRIESADPWKEGGTGLGLALVKRLTEHLGGSIQVESAALKTTFTVELPNQAVLSKVS